MRLFFRLQSFNKSKPVSETAGQPILQMILTKVLIACQTRIGS